MRKDLMVYNFNSKDEYGEVKAGVHMLTAGHNIENVIETYQDECVSFLLLSKDETTDAYLDIYGVIHEVYQGKDQPFNYYFEVIDNDFNAVINCIEKKKETADEKSIAMLNEIINAVKNYEA